MENNKGLLRPTVIITFCSILGILVSFLSQLIIAYYFGAKFERDAYFVASTIPIYISAIFTGSIGIVFLPRVVNILNSKQREISSFLSTVFWLMAITLSLIVVLTMCFSRQVVEIVAAGFNPEQNAYSAKLLVISIPSVIFNVLGNLLSSLYQIRNKFLRPALAPIVTSLVSLICVIILCGKIGIFGLAVGLLLGSILSFIILLPVLKYNQLKLFINLKDVDIQAFIKTLLPLFISGIVFRSTSIFERMIASSLPEGSISYLGYSNQILTILATLTSSGIAVSVYPALSKYWSEQKEIEFTQLFVKIVRVIMLISLPIALTVIFYGDVFIKILFERGAFNPIVTHAVSLALAWSMGAFVFQNLGNIITKIFYISGRTMVISIIASVELILYILLGFFLCKQLSFIGLSIALSVSSMMNIFLSVIYINKRIIKIEPEKLLNDLLKVLLMNTASIVIVYGLTYFFNYSNNILLFIYLFVGILTYYLFGLLFRIEEFILIDKKINALISGYDRRNKIQ